MYDTSLYLVLFLLRILTIHVADDRLVSLIFVKVRVVRKEIVIVGVAVMRRLRVGLVWTLVIGVW